MQEERRVLSNDFLATTGLSIARRNLIWIPYYRYHNGIATSDSGSGAGTIKKSEILSTAGTGQEPTHTGVIFGVSVPALEWSTPFDLKPQPQHV